MFRAMRIYATVVRSGSLSAAGRELGISAASISRYIAALEVDAGSQLLNRSSRSLTMTDSGEIFYNLALNVLAQVEAANSQISGLHKQARGTLRVHSRVLVAETVIIPAMPEFYALYPDIRIDMIVSNEVMDLVDQNIDVDIRIGMQEDSALIMKKLIASERVLCAAPSYLATRPPVETPQDLLGHDCLPYRVHAGLTVWRFADAAGLIQEIPIEGPYQTNHGPALRQLALEGMGVVLMPEWAVHHDLAAGKLVPLLPQYRVSYGYFETGIYAVYQPSRRNSVKVRTFVDFVSRKLRDYRDIGGTMSF